MPDQPDDAVDDMIRRAIGGDAAASAWISEHADTTTVAVVVALAALLERKADRLPRAHAVALTNRDRQIVAIAGAHLDGRTELVDALARDHLVDHPDSVIVAWIAADSVARRRPAAH